MLSRLIATDFETFSRNNWGREPLLSRNDALPRDFTDLLSTDAVDELLSVRGVRAPFIRMAKEGSLLARDDYLGPAGVGAEIGDQVDSAKVLSAFADGSTIVLQGLHRLWPPLIDFTNSLVDDLSHPVQCNAYITPAQNRGFDPHYDVHDVFVMQIAGAKKWTIHRPVYENPLADQPWTDHRDAIGRRTYDEPYLSTTLSPGDALYLPRGWLHSAQATGDTSIHVTIGVPALTHYDVMRTALEELAHTDPQLRSSLPMGSLRGGGADLNGEIASAIASVLLLLHNTDSNAIATSLRSSFANRIRPAPVRPLATVEAMKDAESATVMLRPGLTTQVTTSNAGVRIHLRGRTITFPRYCDQAVRHALSGDKASAATLLGLNEADSTVVIRRLLREGVVVVSE